MSTKLSAMSVGSSVYLNVNGSKKEFIIVHQGKPSSLYDDSCNGTWLLMKDIYESRQWHSSNSNDYANSTIHAYLNGTFLGLFDADIQSAIKQVKIPYRPGSGTSKTVNSGSSGLSAKIFLLSDYEVGWTTSTNQYMVADGACLSYFSGTAATDSKRIANLNGSASYWWLRSPNANGTSHAWYVGSSGSYHGSSCSYSYGVRPALVLDSSLSVSTDGTVQTNSAPSVPSSISYPTTIMGGSSITVSWGTSTDADGNFAGYKVEKSTNGGSSWTQIYQGTATSTTDTVTFGTSSVMYRVKGYDTEGEESSYKAGSQVTVINNTAPSAPSSISVPTTVKGGASLVISWGSSTDSENNLSGYILERSVNGGTWTQVYKNTGTTYTDSITKGWNKVQYRVKAYDPYSESGYTTSPERTVDNNSEPTITCSYSNGANLGTKSSGFSITYSVNDADSADTVTVTEKLDGVTKRQYTATKGANNSFAVTGDYFQKVLNGSHVLTIEATDGKATTTLTLNFTKSVTAAVITLAEPMEADSKISICAIAVAGSIPSDAQYTVEVTNNGKDDSPVWEDCTTESKNGRNYLFQNDTAAKGFAFNFRVTAKRGSSGTGGYITSIQGGFQ